MASTNITWIKLFLSILDEDDRFLYQLNESQQLLYVKLLLLAGVTANHIPKRPKFICGKVNYSHEEECFLKDIARIQEVFPKFTSTEEYYYFTNFHEHHNRIQDDKYGVLAKLNSGSNHDCNSGSNRVDESGSCQSRVEESRIDIMSVFNDLWGKYPRRDGRKEALRHFVASVKTEKDVEDIKLAVDNYIKYLKDNKIEPKFVKMGSTWFNNWQDWIECKSTPQRRIIA